MATLSERQKIPNSQGQSISVDLFFQLLDNLDADASRSSSLESSSSNGDDQNLANIWGALSSICYPNARTTVTKTVILWIYSCSNVMRSGSAEKQTTRDAFYSI